MRVAIAVLLGGLFGPTKGDVRVEIQPTKETCRPTEFMPREHCCWRLCFRVMNDANKKLVSWSLDVIGKKDGRSTPYEFQLPYPARGGPESDRIIEPKSSGLECFDGYFAGAKCDALRITTSVRTAEFE